ncbi:MAG: hypothetical protein K8R64_06525 [Methanosarcinaceae archaeon]|nr:hypothetical protein [Methanosarcinaceae archaeon]
MSQKLQCKNIKSDLKYLGDIMEKQNREEATPDVARMRKQVEYKKTLCKIIRNEKALQE